MMNFMHLVNALPSLSCRARHGRELGHSLQGVLTRLGSLRDSLVSLRTNK